MNFQYLYTSFDGRINRKPFWIAGIILAVASVIINILLGALFGGSVIAAILALLVMLAFLYPSLALTVKRLHDRNKPGSYAAVFYAPSVLYGVCEVLGLTGTPTMVGDQTVMMPNTFGWLLMLLMLAVAIWALVELGFLRGTAGQNGYGPDPLGGEPAAVAA